MKVTCVQDDVTQFLPADFKSSTRATTSFESESLLRELLTSLKVRKYNKIYFILRLLTRICWKGIGLKSNFLDPDPNPDPSDPHVFGPPGSGSGSISQRYGSVSGSFCHQGKPWFLLFCDFFLIFIVENNVNVPSKKIKQITFFLN
jgi:hypothetical protein